MSERKPIYSVSRKDLEEENFCTGGPGGQNQNRKKNGVRLRHPESGLSAESRTFKSQEQNRRAAFRKLADKIVAWVRQQLNIDAVRTKTDEIVRTYNAADNRVVDKTGVRTSYTEMLGDPAATEHVVDARRETKFLEAVKEQDDLLRKLHGKD